MFKAIQGFFRSGGDPLTQTNLEALSRSTNQPTPGGPSPDITAQRVPDITAQRVPDITAQRVNAYVEDQVQNFRNLTGSFAQLPTEHEKNPPLSTNSSPPVSTNSSPPVRAVPYLHASKAPTPPPALNLGAAPFSPPDDLYRVEL